MSYSSIPISVPESFTENYNSSYLPLTPVDHISALQNLGATGGQIYAPQCTAPLIVTPTAAQTWTLPSAETLIDIFGTAERVQLGDFFIIPMLNLGTASATIVPGIGGYMTGTKSIAAYSSSGTVYQNVCISFTNVPLSSSGATYVVQ